MVRVVKCSVKECLEEAYISDEGALEAFGAEPLGYCRYHQRFIKTKPY